jgi:glycine/D-amino acid oxidase-like deaminating enzyme
MRPVTPLWLDEPYRPRPPLSGDLEADVAVVGGGVTGILCALLLSRRNARVVLLDGDLLASGASGRNAGFLLEGHHACYRLAVRSHGRDLARLLWTLTRENHELLADLVRSENIDCGYARNGSYTLAPSENEAEALRKSVRPMTEDGFGVELLDDTDLARLFPRAGFRAGLFHPGNGEVHPARLVRGLAAAAEQRGAKIFEQSPARAQDPGLVVAPGGRVRAPVIILATNAALGAAHPAFRGAVLPMRGQALATEPCPRRLVPAPVYADFGFEYFRQLPDGRIVAGGGRRAALDQERCDRAEPSAPVQEAIERFLRAVLPEAADLRVTHRWGGLMAWSPDELPAIGRVPGAPGLLAAGGYHGHGLAFSAVAARALTALALDGREDPRLGPFDPARFQSNLESGSSTT